MASLLAATVGLSCGAHADDRPYLGLDSPSVREGDAGTTTLTFNARLTDANGRAKSSSETITATYEVLSEAGDTATAGKDYRPARETLTFAPGETAATIDVAVLGDTEVEGDETLSVKWVSWSNVLLVKYATAGTITDDDEEAPYLGLDSPSVREGDAGTTTLTFNARLTDANGRTKSSGRTITATYEVLSEAGDTATAGEDYRPARETLTFAPGETAATIDVAVLGDTEVEGDETLSVKWVSWSNVLLVRYATAGTITDDDEARPAPGKTPVTSGALTIADASATEGDALSFAVTLGKSVPGGLTVTPTFTDGVVLPGKDLSSITAQQGSDYKAGSPTLDFTGKAGETMTFTVPTIEDGAAEYPELFTVGLTVSGTTHPVTATDTATGTIYDDDAGAGARAMSNRQIQDKGTYWRVWSPPDPVTNRYEYFCDVSKRVVETTNRAIRSKVFQIPCKVHRGGIPAGADINMWSTGSATATNGSSGDWDYNFYHSRVRMYPGDHGIQRLSFRINDDQGVEKAESFQFDLKWSTKVGYPPFWFTLNESVHTLTVNIDDDDEYQLTVSPQSVTESGGAKTVTVTATNVGGAKLSEARKISVQVGAGSDFAVEGTDYQTVSNFDITIPKGSSSGSGTFTLTPVDDAHLEAGERITVSGSGSSQINGGTLTPRVRGTGLWLIDNETITVSASPDVDEGGGTQTVTLTATGSGTAQRAIPLTISAGLSGDSATEGIDFRAMSSTTLTIRSGSLGGNAMAQGASSNGTTLGTIQITPINDTTLENDETITISANAGPFALSSAIPGTSVKLLDNDVNLSLSPTSVGEEGGAQTVTVTARAKTARATARALTVSVGKAGDSAEAGTDYGTVADFSLTIPANQASGTATFTFTPRDDKIIEGTETVTVGGTGTGLDVNSATLTMTETDTTDFVITLNPNPVAEGVNWRNLVVTISTTGGYTVSKDVGCQFQNGGGSATWGSDYYLHYSNKGIKPPGTPGTSIIPTLTINAGQTSGSKTVRLRTIADNAVEGDETVQIKGHSLYPHVYKSCRSSDNPRTVDSDPYPADLTIIDDETSISLSASPSSVAENAGATSVTVTASMGGNRNAPADMPVTVTVGKSGDSATSGTDYEAVDAFKITIPQGKKSATETITFTPKDDTLAEDDETITLTGKTPKTSVSSTQLTIDDDDDTGITLTASPASVSEGGGAKTVTVTAKTDGTTFPAPRHVNVQVGKTGDGATEGTDYKTVANFTVTIPFAKTKGTGTFTLTPVDDTTIESDESISISGTTSSSDTVKGTSVTIKDNDFTAITLSASPASVAENGGAKTVTVTATKGSAEQTATTVTISVGESGDSATSGTDYTAVDDFTVTIAANKTTGTGTFTLTPVDDDLYEGASESLTISGSAAGYTVSDTSVTITDNDDTHKATVSLSVKPKRVKECSGDTTMTVTATMPDDVFSLPEARDLAISVGKSGDSATSGTDYTAVNDFTLSIPAGQHTGLATFTLTPTDDTNQEGDETITLSGSAKRLGVGNDATVTIEDDDQPIIVLTMNPSTIPETKAGTTTDVDVTASLWDSKNDRCAADEEPAPPSTDGTETAVGASAAEVAQAVLGPGASPASSVSDQTVTVTIGDTGDTAVSGTDYTAVNDFDIVIKAGDTSGKKTFTTRASLDNLLEPRETLTAKGAASGTTVAPATGHVDDKDKVEPTLTVSPTSVSEGAGDTTMTVTLNTGGVTASESVEVPFRVSGGTATAGTDFAKVEDFDLVLEAGETSLTGTFTLTPTEDTLIEGNETLNVHIPGSTPALSDAATITDNDETDITLTATPASVTEDGGKKTVTVEAATDGDTFVADTTVTVTVGDSTDSATEGTDYATVADFDVTIKAGKTKGSATFDLTPTNDAVFEGDETLSVDGTATGLTVHGDSVTLDDDDSAAVTVADVNEDEGDDLTFTVTLDTAVQGGLTVTPDFTDGTAVEGTDYDENTAALTFTGTASETQTFTVQTTEDTMVEANETFTVGLTVSDAPSGITATDTATGTIDNDDDATVTIASASTAEGGSLSFTATLDKAVDGGLTATPAYTDGTATEGTDYTANTTALSFTGTANETQTFTVQTTEDAAAEDDETFTVTPTISGLQTGVAGVTGAAGTGTITDDDGVVDLSVTPASVTENGGKKTVTVTATTAYVYAAAKTITVSVGKNGDSAVEGTDYTAVADFTLTITANKKSGTATFDLTPTDDNIIEADETLSVDGSATGLTVNGTSATITDNEVDDIDIDIDVEPFLDANPDKLAENGGAKTIKVTAGTKADKNGVFPVFPLDREVQVTVGDSTDSATSGIDYDAVAGFTVTIKANSSSGSKEFTLTPKDDTLVEGNEAITVKGSASGLKVTKATITLTDDDTPNITLAESPSSVGEGAGDTTVTVTAATGGVTFKADRTVTVSVGKSGDGAESGTDYDAVTDFDVTIDAGKTKGSAAFTLTPTDDTLVEDDEAITVSGTTTGYDVTGASMTLTDNDTAPKVNLSVAPSSVSEGDSATEVTVTATFSNTSTYLADTTVTVSVGDAADSATSGTDYSAVAVFDVTIAKGKSSGTATFTLTPKQDTLVEGNETITVAGTHATLTVNGTSVTLTDDDGAPAINLSVQPSSVAESAGDTTVTVTATFSNTSTYATDTTLMASVGKNGTATSGTDYTAVTDFAVTIKANASSGSADFTLAPIDDVLVEGNETIAVGGTVDAGAEAVANLTVNGISMTLTDNDHGDLGLAAAPASLAETAGETTVTVTATTGGVTFKQDETVNVTVGLSNDSATKGTDYTAVEDAFDITIAKGQTSAAGTFELTPVDDKLIESHETIGVAGTADFGAAKAVVTLTGDDLGSKRPPIYLTASPSSVSEDGGEKTITVTATVIDGMAFTEAKTVTVSVGASGDSAVKGTDYAAQDDVFDIAIAAAANSGSATFKLTPTDDVLVEPDETITLSGSAANLDVSPTTITIGDDEAKPYVVVDSPSVQEGDSGTTTLTFAARLTDENGRREKPSTETITAAYKVSSEDGDTATAGADYAATSGTLTFAPGETSKTVGVAVAGDTLVEGDETFTWKWTQWTKSLLASYTYKGTIEDDDDTPEVNLAVAPSSVSEGAGATAVTVTAAFSNDSTFEADTTVTVRVGDRGDSATQGSDYAAVADFTVTIAAGQTRASAPFTLTPRQDILVEGDETISVAGTATGLTVNGTGLTLADDDAAPAIVLSVSPSSVGEGAGATPVTVTATFSNTNIYEANTTVTVRVGDSGTATSGTDYADVRDFTVTIPAGARSGSAPFTLTPVDDALIEGDEDMTVDGSAGGLLVMDADVDLIDNDGDPAIILAVTPNRVGEGDGATAVSLTAAFSNDSVYEQDTAVTVRVGAAGDSAASGVDYARVSDFRVTIAAGASNGSAAFTLTPVQDALVEGDETISVVGAAAGLAVRGTSVALTDNDATPAIRLSASPSSVAEGDGATAVTVTAAFSNASVYARDTAVTVRVGAAGDSATSGIDYARVSDFRVTIAAGASSGSAAFTLTPVQDALVEGDETIGLGGTATGLTVHGTGVALTDDDAAPAINLSASPASVSEGDGTTSVTVTAAFSNASVYAQDTTVRVRVGDAADSAVSGTDYAAVVGFDVTIAAGAARGSAVFILAPVDDTRIEDDETISVAGTAAGLTVNGTSVVLQDNDGTPTISLSAPPRIAENAGATTATVTATFSNASTFDHDTTVRVTVGDTADSAVAGTDYARADDFEVTIPAGRTTGSATFPLAPIDDTLIEGDESISVAGAATGLQVNGARVALTDDDGAPIIQLAVVPATVSEGAGATAMTLTATFSNDSLYPDAKTVRVSVGKPGDGATSSADYAPVAPFDLTIAAGATQAEGAFVLTPTDDTLIEGDESITVWGTNPTLAVAGDDVALIDDDAPPTVILSAVPASISESAGATSVTVTATFSNASTYGVDVPVAVTVGADGDSAVSGADYAGVAGFEVTVAAGESSGSATFTLSPVADALVEGREWITVWGANPTLAVNATFVGLTDAEAPPTISLAAIPASVAEGDGATAATVIATFSNASTYAHDTTVTVTVGDRADSAESGTDYAAVASFDVTIAAGATSGRAAFTLTPVDDTLIEGDETISIAGVAGNLTVTGTHIALTDDDAAPDVDLAVEPSRVAEDAGATTMTVTATFSNASTFAADTTVTVAVGDAADGAVSGIDYATVTSFDVTIAAGQRNGRAAFTLTPIDDTLIEGDETISIAGVAGNLTVTGTHIALADDDAAPDVDLAVEPSRVAEDAGATTMTVTATFSNASTYTADTTVTVAVGNAADSATTGADYAAVRDFEVTIAAGQTSGNAAFTLTPVDDTLVEGEEMVSVGGAAAGLTVHGTSFRLTDGDAAPEVRLAVTPRTVGEGDGDAAMTVTATFSNDATYAHDTTVAVTVGDRADSATTGADYAAVASFDVTIAAGATSGRAAFTLTPVDDTLIEGDETISIAGVAGNLTVTGTHIALADDDAAPDVDLAVEPSSVAEDAGATTMTVTATFSNASTYTADSTVTVAVGNAADSATTGADYAAVRDFEVTIAAGQTSGGAAFTLTLVDDTLVEGEEMVSVGGAAAGLTVHGTSFALTDDEGAPVVDLAVEPSEVGEGDGDAEVTVTAEFSTESTYAADTTVAVTIGDPADSAVAGVDYAAVPGFEVAIPAGQTSGRAAFTLIPTRDTLVEGEESLSVHGKVAGLVVRRAQLALTDNDAAPEVRLVVEPSSVGEGEGDAAMTVTAEFTNASTYIADTTVTVTVGDSADSATSGTDYDAVPGFEVTIAAGQTSGSAAFNLAPVDDTLVEGDETVSVAGVVAGLTVHGTSFLLTDDDAAPQVRLAVVPSALGEGDADAPIEVTATFTNASTYQHDTTVTVHVGEVADSAAAGTDYAAVPSFDVTIAAGASSGGAAFTFAPVDDTLVESDETVSVGGTAAGLTVHGTSLTLTDDDAVPAVELTVLPSAVGEGDGDAALTVTATFSNASTYAADTTVRVAVGDGADSATSGTDYADVSDFDVTIAAGASSGGAAFTFAPVDDTLVESDETVSVGGTATGLTVRGTSLTLTDDDAAPAVDLAVVPSRVGEGAGDAVMTVTAAFSNASTFARDTRVTITVGDAADSAVSGTDYAAVPGFEVTIAAGASSGSAAFTLALVDDTLVEGDETVGVGGEAAGLTVFGTHVTLIDDDAAPTVQLAATPSRVGEGEGGSDVVVTATFSNASTYARDTRVTITVGDAADSATSGADYANVSDFEVTIAAGASSGAAAFTLAPVGDTLVEGDETISIGGATAGLTVFGTHVALIDDDAAPAVHLAVEPSRVGEGDGAAALTVTATFSNASTYAADTTVTVAVGDAADGATSGTDYAAVPGFEVTIPAGGTSGSAAFTLVPVDDTLVEGDEMISVDGVAAGLDVYGAAIWLADNDAAPQVDLAISPASVAEDAGSTLMTVTATLSNASTYAADTAVTVTVGDAGDSAERGADYAQVADFQLTIAAGAGTGSAAFTLTPTQDGLYEVDETIAVSGHATELVVNGTQAMLTDDDRIRDPVQITVADATADEGDTLVFAVRLSRTPVGRTVAVDFRTRDLTATAGEDYEANSGSLTFQPGETERTVAVQTFDDELDEDSETLALDLGGVVHAVLEDDEGIGTLGNDDSLSAAWIARFGRTASAHVMDAVDARLRHTDGRGTYMTVGSGMQSVPEGTADPTGDPALAAVAPPPPHLASLDDPWSMDAMSMSAMPPMNGMPPMTGMQPTSVMQPHGPEAGSGAWGGWHGAGRGASPLSARQRNFDVKTRIRNMLAGSAFQWTPERPEEEDDNDRTPPRWTVWGQGATTRFDGRQGGVSLSGDVLGATLGADAQWQRVTAGVALAWNDGRGRYSDADSGRSGRLKSTLASVHPYARWTNGRLSLWGLLGHGRGEYAVVPAGGDGRAISTGLRMNMAGFGAHRGLSTAERLRGVELALRSDAMLVQMHADAVAGYLRETRTQTSHARLYLEGSRRFEPGGGHVLTPALELGLRHDAGDAETGTGVELAARFAYENRARGVRMEVHGHRLLAHGAEGLEIWGGGGSVVFDSGINGLGLSLRLRPTWGTAQGGVADMWGANAVAGLHQSNRADPTGRIDADMGYGLPALGGRGILTLMGASSVSQDGERRFGLGGRLTAGEVTELSLLGEQRERPDGKGEFGFVLRARSIW